MAVQVQIQMQYVNEYYIKENNTTLVLGKIVNLFVKDEIINKRKKVNKANLKIVENIINNVRKNKDRALIAYERKFNNNSKMGLENIFQPFPAKQNRQIRHKTVMIFFQNGQNMVKILTLFCVKQSQKSATVDESV